MSSSLSIRNPNGSWSTKPEKINTLASETFEWKILIAIVPKQIIRDQSGMTSRVLLNLTTEVNSGMRKNGKDKALGAPRKTKVGSNHNPNR